MKKQMSDESVMWVYLRYFLGRLKPCLTEAQKAKSTKDDLSEIVFIGGLSA